MRGWAAFRWLFYKRRMIPCDMIKEKEREKKIMPVAKNSLDTAHMLYSGMTAGEIAEIEETDEAFICFVLSNHHSAALREDYIDDAISHMRDIVLTMHPEGSLALCEKVALYAVNLMDLTKGDTYRRGFRSFAQIAWEKYN